MLAVLVYHLERTPACAAPAVALLGCQTFPHQRASAIRQHHAQHTRQAQSMGQMDFGVLAFGSPPTSPSYSASPTMVEFVGAPPQPQSQPDYAQMHPPFAARRASYSGAPPQPPPQTYFSYAYGY